MQNLESDTLWALVTLLATVMVGLAIALLIIMTMGSHRISTNLKRLCMLMGFGVFAAWLFTMGNPDSKMSLEAVYKKNFSARHESGRT